MYKREIERKFTIENMSYVEAALHLRRFCWCIVNTATSKDTYWESPTVDFIRLRENSKEFTIKVTDKGSIIDRIEENVVVEDTATANRLATLLFGMPKAVLTKTFSVFQTDINFKKVTVCLYTVKGDPKSRLFFEVEADTIDAVDTALEVLSKGLQLNPEFRSLYQIFKEEGVNEEAA